jgi:uncharacterized protein YbbC (DUF1343 family)
MTRSALRLSLPSWLAGCVLAAAVLVPYRLRAGVDAGDAGPPAMPPSALAELDRLVSDAIAQGKLPGCVVAIGRARGLLYQKAFGARALVPEREPMTLDTIFDLASLTKPIATATAVMLLVEQGKLDLDRPVAHYLPAFGAHGKSAITLRHLLTHVSGLPAETAIADYERGRAFAMKRIFALTPKIPPETKTVYSDVGFLVLQEVVERVTGESLATFTRRKIFAPLGMNDTGFRPPAAQKPRIAPTERRNDAWMRGEVHDPRAFRLGGVAGHAGLFSTAQDLARFARMVLGQGSIEGVRLLSARTLATMLAPHDVPGGIRALGWDVQSAYSANRGTTLSPRAVGHGGYTGTALWIDPAQDLFIVFLSNRVHPDGKGSVNALAGAIATIAGSVYGRSSPVPLASPTPAKSPEAEPPLALGIDALAAEGFARLRGQRIALLTNDSARTRDGRRTTDVLADCKDLTLVALLSPEHGLSAKRDERIGDGVDDKTKVPVLSLYGGAMGPRGKPPAGPRPVTLPTDIDAVVVDLPDVGVRFFTYASTVHAVLRAAAARLLPVVVLDRPNPLGGIEVSGPVLKDSERSPVNHFALPIQHGMTMGELALMMNAVEHLGAAVEVVRMPRYDRRLRFDQTGLAWYPPSPNLRTVDQAMLYPGVALVEATNVSVGRGTETPFEVVGAPWIDGKALAAELADASLTGVVVEPARFTPTAAPYAGRACQGVRLRLADRASVAPVHLGLTIAVALRKLYPRTWDASRLRRMLGDPAVAAAIIDGETPEQIEVSFQSDLDAFRARRSKYLLYESQLVSTGASIRRAP